MSNRSHWAHATKELRQRLARAISREELKELHRLQPVKHLVVLAWQYLLLALASTGSFLFDRWYLWLPCAVVAGFTIFNFTVMLHEVIHGSVFRGGERGGINTFFGWLYAFPSGISRSQFKRWHLDHHAGLGTVDEDPKRHHLSPRRTARWCKMLYLTPALIPIYFRAASREAKIYSAELRHKIARQRLITVFGQLAILGVIVVVFGWWIAMKVYLFPYFIVFPVAFTLNRLGQHYFIKPEDPAKWGTRMKRNLLWDVVFLYSSYHLEHHYFPRVPFYNLRRLNRALEPFWEEMGHRPVGYGELLWRWFVANAIPHTDWDAPRGKRERPS